jgi:2-keto-4-pentenoate hydratase/2-oxohepta-3-ene-1,7-dioic acid hydratase in catechol pathway
MRLATFVRVTDPGRPRVGVLCEGRMLDVADGLRMFADIAGTNASSMKALLSEGKPGLDAVDLLLERAIYDLDGRMASCLVELDAIEFLPPVPDADKFLCVGKNYRAHLEELKRTDLIKEIPQEPTGFIKLNSALTGHQRDVVRPAGLEQLDYEPELVFVIGRRAAGVGKDEDPMSYVAGITILNDLTCRETQKREVASGSRFWTAKNAPGFGPMGPFIITMDEVPDPYNIWVTCSVNGEERMRVNTADQIWKLGDILHHFSRLVPIEPGDMFSTGAPGGVAVGKPNAEALYLKPGDVVECAFDHPPMTLRTRIVSPQ